jgi:hypothetical protein
LPCLIAQGFDLGSVSASCTVGGPTMARVCGASGCPPITNQSRPIAMEIFFSVTPGCCVTDCKVPARARPRPPARPALRDMLTTAGLQYVCGEYVPATGSWSLSAAAAVTVRATPPRARALTARIAE